MGSDLLVSAILLLDQKRCIQSVDMGFLCVVLLSLIAELRHAVCCGEGTGWLSVVCGYFLFVVMTPPLPSSILSGAVVSFGRRTLSAASDDGWLGGCTCLDSHSSVAAGKLWRFQGARGSYAAVSL